MKVKSILLVFAALAGALQAQPKGAPATVLGDLKNSYQEIKDLIMRAAEQMPESTYSYKPVPEEMSFGGWVAHVADAQGFICGAAAGGAKQLGAASKTAKADLLAVLKQSFDLCDGAYQATTDANVNESIQSFRGPTPRLALLYGNISHDNECYGSMAVYMRLNKLVPPSSQGRGGGGKGGDKGKGK